MDFRLVTAGRYRLALRGYHAEIIDETSTRHIDNIYTVVADDRQGIRLALDHLKEHGHRRIGCLFFNDLLVKQANSNFRNRLAACEEWMKESRIIEEPFRARRTGYWQQGN